MIWTILMIWAMKSFFVFRRFNWSTRAKKSRKKNQEKSMIVNLTKALRSGIPITFDRAATHRARSRCLYTYINSTEDVHGHRPGGITRKLLHGCFGRNYDGLVSPPPYFLRGSRSEEEDIGRHHTRVWQY